MRIPHRTTTPVSARLGSFTIFIILGLVMPTVARAATQQLTSSPSSVRFGTVEVGQSGTESIVLTNSGGTSVTISAIRVNNSQFKVSGATLPIVVGAGQKVGLNVTFSPTAGSSTSGSVIFTSNA